MPGSRRRRRWWIPLVCLYLVLLAASHAVEPPYQREPGRDVELSTLRAVRGETLGPEPVRLAWRRWTPDAAADRIPVLLLHGSPGSHHDFDRFAPPLAARGWTLYAPDLPGFGVSTRRVPDYSIRAHARYVIEWLDQLGIERVHVVGFSMGGGVALELARQAPERVASLTMLSSIGVQEMELLGYYSLNHMIHGVQLAGLWILDNAVPHFGALTHFPLDLPYARNFYDTDQRPLRGVLATIEPPVLILHGQDDFLVPREAALEHHRLAPQSELMMLPSPTSHFFVFTGDPDVRPQLADFWERVESGRAARRAEASPERVRLARAPFDRHGLPRWMGPALLVVSGLLALTTLVSEDLATIGGGLLVADGRMPFGVATAACFAGIFFGDLLIFGAGRVLGRPILRRAPLRWWLDDEAVAKSSAWFERRGGVVVLISRFMPGTRFATYFTAGLLRTSFWRFALYMAIAVGIWTPLLVLAARAAGDAALERIGAFHANLLLIVVAALLLSLVARQLVVPLFSRRGRRELVGTWRRWTRWEFWPPWLFYPPVLAYALWLGVRHRGLTVFTAANPAFPAGGFIGESKAAILAAVDAALARVALAERAQVVARERATDAGARVAAIASTRAATGVMAASRIDVAAVGGATATAPAIDEPWIRVPSWRRIDPGPLDTRLSALREFLDRAQVAFPIVLKPDVGQRGQAVEIASDEAAAARWLEGHPGAAIAQRYAAGREYGVFYYRHPGEERGRLFSITEKEPPEVVGDGRSTLDELVLADRRAVAIAHVYRRELGARRDSVPAAGERVTLIDIGTHARGSIFRDGSRHATAALEIAIDELSRAIDGFCFGRYDVRVESVEDLEAGRGLAVLELNGVTAESTDIYDPGNSVLDAWRQLMRQWRLAYEIGAANRADGAPVTTVAELLRLMWGNRRFLPR